MIDSNLLKEASVHYISSSVRIGGMHENNVLTILESDRLNCFDPTSEIVHIGSLYLNVCLILRGWSFLSQATQRRKKEKKCSSQNDFASSKIGKIHISLNAMTRVLHPILSSLYRSLMQNLRGACMPTYNTEAPLLT